VLELCCRGGRGSTLLAETASTIVGIDHDAALVDVARSAVGSDRVSFEAVDPLSFLDRALDDRFDAIVCLQGWEHLRDQARLMLALRHHADSGIKLVWAIANGHPADDPASDRTTERGFETALGAFAGFPQTTTVPQYRLEGSVFAFPESEPIELGRAAESHLTIEYASHLIVCVGFPTAVVMRAAHARASRIAARASRQDRYVMNLELANQELLRANARLAGGDPAGAAAEGQPFGHSREPAAGDEAMRSLRARAEAAERDRDLWRQRCLAAESRSRIAAVSPAEHPPLERPEQAAGLDLHEVSDGLIVHHVGQAGVQYLNNTAAMVFQFCDGNHTVGEIAAQLALAFGMTELPTDLVERCIEDLRRTGVLA